MAWTAFRLYAKSKVACSVYGKGFDVHLDITKSLMQRTAPSNVPQTHPYAAFPPFKGFPVSSSNPNSLLLALTAF